MDDSSSLTDAPDDPLWDSDRVSNHLGIPKATLYQWRHRGLAPRAIRVGKHTRYRRSDVEAWIEAHADLRPGGS